jgi:hypothetical protein
LGSPSGYDEGPLDDWVQRAVPSLQKNNGDDEVSCGELNAEEDARSSQESTLCRTDQGA